MSQGHSLGQLYTDGPFYMGLYRELPSDESPNGVEVDSPGYTRVEIPVTLLGIALVNRQDICFPTATSAWGTIVGFGVFKQGELLLSGNVTTLIDVLEGTQVIFKTGSITIGFGALSDPRHMFRPKKVKTLWERLEEDRDFHGG